jgi:Rho GDP-dissociation inhibitor
LLSRQDQNDESLRRWKESLGIGAGSSLSDPKDPRKVIIASLGLEADGRDDIIIDLTAPGAVDKLKEKPFTIKEGASFRMKAIFKVQHEVLSGMKYLQVVKRKGIRVGKTEEMIVSYPLPMLSISASSVDSML